MDYIPWFPKILNSKLRYCPQIFSPDLFGRELCISVKHGSVTISSKFPLNCKAL